MPHSFVLHRKSRWRSVPMKNCLKFGKSKRNTSRKCSNKKSPSSLIGWRGFFIESPLSEQVLLPAQAEPTRGLKFEQRKEGLPEYPSESCDQCSAKPPKSPYFSPFPPRQGLLYLDLLNRLKSHGISYYADAVTPSVFVDVPVAEAVYVHRVPLRPFLHIDGILSEDGVAVVDYRCVGLVHDTLNNLRGAGGEDG